MKYTVKEVVFLVVMIFTISYFFGFITGKEWEKKPIPQATACSADPNEGKWLPQSHGYQIDINEPYLSVYDGKRYVGRVRIKWLSPLGKLLKADNY